MYKIDTDDIIDDFIDSGIHYTSLCGLKLLRHSWLHSVFSPSGRCGRNEVQEPPSLRLGVPVKVRQVSRDWRHLLPSG